MMWVTEPSREYLPWGRLVRQRKVKGTSLALWQVLYCDCMEVWKYGNLRPSNIFPSH